MEILCSSIVVWSISTTITSQKVFAPLRTWARTKGEYFGYLCECQHCCSHWIALVITIAMRPQLVWSSGIGAVDFVFTVFLLVGISSMVARVFTFLKSVIQ